jgi:hypothetical protein
MKKITIRALQQITQDEVTSYRRLREILWDLQGNEHPGKATFPEATKDRQIVFVPRRNIFMKDTYICYTPKKAFQMIGIITSLEDSEVKELSYRGASFNVQLGGKTGAPTGMLEGQLDDKREIYKG